MPYIFSYHGLAKTHRCPEAVSMHGQCEAFDACLKKLSVVPSEVAQPVGRQPVGVAADAASPQAGCACSAARREVERLRTASEAARIAAFESGPK